MKTAVFFTKSFKPDAEEEKAIANARKTYRFVSVRNAMFYDKAKCVEDQYDAVLGAVSSKVEKVTENDTVIKTAVTTTAKPNWVKNK